MADEAAPHPGEVRGFYTPNPDRPGLRECLRVACLVPTDPAIVWHYAGCEHHIREMIQANRDAGADRYTFFLFRTGTEFCGPCWHLDGYCGCTTDHTRTEAIWMSNQVAFEVQRGKLSP